MYYLSKQSNQREFHSRDHPFYPIRPRLFEVLLHPELEFPKIWVLDQPSGLHRLFWSSLEVAETPKCDGYWTKFQHCQYSTYRHVIHIKKFLRPNLLHVWNKKWPYLLEIKSGVKSVTNNISKHAFENNSNKSINSLIPTQTNITNTV